MKKYKFLLSVILLTGCAGIQQNDMTPSPKDAAPGSTDVILCENPRPQMCTREYAPVCATLSNGTQQTYATACTSCSDTSVISYVDGECSMNTGLSAR